MLVLRQGFPGCLGSCAAAITVATVFSNPFAVVFALAHAISKPQRYLLELLYSAEHVVASGQKQAS